MFEKKSSPFFIRSMLPLYVSTSAKPANLRYGFPAEYGTSRVSNPTINGTSQYVLVPSVTG